jgi:Zn-dependent protease with chaperone function
MATNRTANPDYSILAAFDQPIVRPKTGFLYQVCLLLVAVTMLILPLVYIAFVGGLAWLTYHHAVYNWAPIMRFGGFAGGVRVQILKFLVYAVPLCAGIVVTFFMFKPLLAGRPKHAQPLALNPSDNPLLYAFIARICDVVGAPTPKRIDMDCELNASASFRRGFRSMTGNDLVLTIGLPLVANFSTREFAGVIAHEFGHFTQGAGMRLSYIIRSINFWFARVAYQRDAWDEALEEWSNEVQDGRVAIIVWSVQIAVWFSRLFLKLLMYTGHIIAGFMLRQMEYDADTYQIKVVGSETFEVTHRKLATLSAAMHGTYTQIGARWKKTRQLPDNLSELVRQMHENLPADVLKEIDDTLGFQRTGLMDTHPSPADRIRRARMAGEPGIFHDDRPASSLFANFEHPARFVTLLHYTDNLGIPITDQMLLRVESKQSNDARGYAAAKTDPADEFFLGMLPLLLPLRIKQPAPSANIEADIAELQQLSAGLQQISEQIAPMAAQYKEASQKRMNARIALRLLGMGMVFEPKTLGLASATMESAKAAEAEASEARESLRRSLHEVTAALNRRLELALAIKLADTGESSANSIPSDLISKLTNQLNQSAEDYENREETRNALAVLNHLDTIKQSVGETPAISRALATQKEFVNSLNPFQNEPNEAMPKPGLQLRIAKQPNHVGSSEIESLRQKTDQWFVDYRKSISQLADAALAADSAPL